MPGCFVYLDDVIDSDTWADHLCQLNAFFTELGNAGLVVNLAKSDFVCAQSLYLSQVTGLGKLASKV